MKLLFMIMSALLICSISSTTFAALSTFGEAPTCVMLKFSNDTRYKNIDSASVLSELVFEKLLAKGKFNFKETKPIDKDMELMLYDEKMRDINNLQKSIERGNFNELFEDGSFSSKYAQSIATAKVGQIVSPSITQAIGREHGAEYLIQGTIVNLGQGNFSDKFYKQSSFGSKGFYFYQKTAAVGVEVALRVIKAETGEVIWAKEINEIKKTDLVQVGIIMVGTAKLTTDMYSDLMEKAAQKISDELVGNMVGGRLFAK